MDGQGKPSTRWADSTLKKDAALSLFWPLVRILDVYPNNNGIIRTVTLRITKRSVL